MSDERLRLFVALVLPSQIIEALLAWRADATDAVAGLRLLEPEQLHVTLCFLGWQPLEAVEEIAGVCRAATAATSVSELALGQPVWLPPHRPRVLAVELDDARGGLAELQSELSRRLETGGWYVPERRKYMAHVTVARVRRGAKTGDPRSRAGARSPRGAPALPRPPMLSFPPALAHPPALSFGAIGVTLFRSRLTRAGARYEALASVGLE